MIHFSFSIDGIPAMDISISSLDVQATSQIPSIISFNQTILNEYNKELNSYAMVREYMMIYTTKFPMKTSNNIKLQASSLAQLTKATNELTRITLVKDLSFFL